MPPQPAVHDGLVAVVKRSCPTCELVAPVLKQIADAGVGITVYSQDDPSFPDEPPALNDRDLEASYRLRIDTVPTLLRFEGGAERRRLEGWQRDLWEDLSGVGDLGPGLPPHRPGCGSLSVAPGAGREVPRHGFAPERVAGFAWNRWSACLGIRGTDAARCRIASRPPFEGVW